jgi:hypothetical protein
MRFVFLSINESGGITQVTFDAITLDEIDEMYKQFLRGSGFFFEDDLE